MSKEAFKMAFFDVDGVLLGGFIPEMNIPIKTWMQLIRGRLDIGEFDPAKYQRELDRKHQIMALASVLRIIERIRHKGRTGIPGAAAGVKLFQENGFESTQVLTGRADHLKDITIKDLEKSRIGIQTREKMRVFMHGVIFKNPGMSSTLHKEGTLFSIARALSKSVEGPVVLAMTDNDAKVSLRVAMLQERLRKDGAENVTLYSFLTTDAHGVPDAEERLNQLMQQKRSEIGLLPNLNFVCDAYEAGERSGDLKPL